MRYQVRLKLYENKDHIIYMRENPVWYRILTRHPEMVDQFIEQYKIDRKLTFQDKMDQMGLMLEMFNALM